MKRKLLMLIFVLNIFITNIYCNNDNSISLTAEEKSYIHTRKPIKLVVDPDWYPYEKIDENGLHQGIVSDLLSLISKRTGLKFELIKTKDWDESILKAKNKEADVISLLNETEERNKWLLFSNPYYSDPNVIITREEHDYVANLSRLSNETIVLPKGTSIEERVRKDYPMLKILLVDSEAKAIEMVDKKKADLTLRSLTMAAYIIKNDGYFNLKIAGEVPEYKNNLRIGIVDKNDLLLKSILDKGIATISQQEIQTAINNHISLKVQLGFDYKLFIIIFGAFSLVLIIILYKNKKIQDLNNSLKLKQQEISITSEKLFEKDILHQTILNTSPDAIILSNLSGEILMASPATKKLLQINDSESIIGKCLEEFIDSSEIDRMYSNFNKLNEKQNNYANKYTCMTTKKNEIAIEVNSELVLNEFGESTKVVSIIRDISDRYAMEQELIINETKYKKIATELEVINKKLKETAIIDSLTGVYNRYYFDEKLSFLMESSLTFRSPLSLILLDLDHFKAVNDTYGHKAGDKVLIEVANTINNLIDEANVFARWGGEEFIVLMPMTNLKDAQNFAEKIRHTLECIDHLGVGTVTVSIGVSTWDYIESSEQWFKRADDYLYKAKNKGRNCVMTSEETQKINYSFISWSDEWLCNNDDINIQHKELLNLSNKLISSIMGDYMENDVDLSIKNLLEHISYHFNFEEKFLNDVSYLEANNHKEKHDILIGKAKELFKSSSKKNMLEDTIRFIINDVIINHLIHEDSKFFQYIDNENSSIVKK